MIGGDGNWIWCILAEKSWHLATTLCYTVVWRYLVTSYSRRTLSVDFGVLQTWLRYWNTTEDWSRGTDHCHLMQLNGIAAKGSGDDRGWGWKLNLVHFSRKILASGDYKRLILIDWFNWICSGIHRILVLVIHVSKPHEAEGLCTIVYKQNYALKWWLFLCGRAGKRTQYVTLLITLIV